MNTEVSFELAKLLKAKWFDKSIDARWYYDNDYLDYRLSLKGISKWTPKQDSYPAPTISDVVMWLYEKHGIWINSQISVGFSFRGFMYQIQTIEKGLHDGYEFNSPTQAYEAAIRYTLENIIK